MSEEDVANKPEDLDSDLTGDDDMQMLTAEYRDGHLQIVEVSPFDGDGDEMESRDNILPDVIDSASPLIMDADKKYVQLDLLNFSLVRCDDGDGESGYQLIANSDLQENYQLIAHDDEESYQLVENAEDPKQAYELVSISDGEDSYTFVDNNEDRENNTEEGNSEGLVTCILQGGDQESQEGEDDAYVMVESENGPVVMLQSTLRRIHTDPEPKPPEPKKEEKKLTAAQLLDRAKRLRKARELKQILARSVSRSNRRGRKRHTDLVPANELLSSPNFRLYLYSCKQCDFKANAMSDLREHRNTEHKSGVQIVKYPVRPRVPLIPCTSCAYKAHSNEQLLKHISDHHNMELTIEDGASDNDEDSDTLLVCSACGFQSLSERSFSQHVQLEHSQVQAC